MSESMYVAIALAHSVAVLIALAWHGLIETPFDRFGAGSLAFLGGLAWPLLLTMAFIYLFAWAAEALIALLRQKLIALLRQKTT